MSEGEPVRAEQREAKADGTPWATTGTRYGTRSTVAVTRQAWAHLLPFTWSSV
jgi:hypothetical protein